MPDVFVNIVVLFFSSIISLPLMAASHHPEDFLHSIEGKKGEGEQIVQQFCANCHAEKPLITLGAPRMNYPLDWQQRLNKDLSGLLKSVNEGIGAMPARGGCFECSDIQLERAIIAMLPAECKKDLLIKLKAHKKSR